tara:strand:- start:27450 stop:27608 length:159 start_codon:yes stop_codon:yes gene_type:complete
MHIEHFTALPGLPLAGLEPATPCLEGRCANHCATRAYLPYSPSVLPIARSGI